MPMQSMTNSPGKYNVVVVKFTYMKTVTVALKNSKAFQILKDLENVDLIELLMPDKNRNKILNQLKPKRNSLKESFFDLKGIWKDKNISLESIRKKAWPQRTR